MSPEDKLDLSQWRQQIDESIHQMQERHKLEDKYAWQSSPDDSSSPFRRHAELLTAFDLLRELSTHAGIPESRFNFVCHQRFLYHLDSLYSDMSDLYKETASRMDDRTEDEIYTGEELPLLFE